MFRLFAELLEYPGPGVREAARACEALASQEDTEAVALLARFRAFVENTPPERVEEVYSATFDLDASCHPYVGYHLFGETYKRSVFLVELKQRYKAAGLDSGRELPDHLALVLRFAGAQTDPTAVAELVHEALLPALDRMTGRARSAGYDQDESPPAEQGAEPVGPYCDESPPAEQGAERDGPYRALLEALRLVLQRIPVAPSPAVIES